jgi:hypothetical protein
MWTDTQFWRDSTWRAFRTFCQTLAAMLAGQTVNVLTAPWSGMLGVSAGAALVSLLMSVDRERVVVAPLRTEPVAKSLDVNAEEPALQASYAAGCDGDLR